MMRNDRVISPGFFIFAGEIESFAHFTFNYARQIVF